MEWLIVLLLILIGDILILMEFLVFPGVNVVGILGFVCVVAGVCFGYGFYGADTGHLVLFGEVLLGIGVTCIVLRSDTWKRFSLDTCLDGGVEGVDSSIKEGDCGVTLGRLAPMGNVRIGGIVVEAESESGYTDSNVEVEVVKVYKNKIVVKLKTV